MRLQELVIVQNAFKNWYVSMFGYTNPHALDKCWLDFKKFLDKE